MDKSERHYMVYKYDCYLLEHLICIMSNTMPNTKHKLPTTM